MQTFIAVLYLLLNLFAFGLYAYDKFQARRGGRRIPENTLLTASILGGCFGGLLAMYAVHHKTRKTVFVAGNVAACLAHAGMLYLFL